MMAADNRWANPELSIIPGERHSVPRENPQLFNLLVDKFLSEPFKDASARF